MVTDPEMLYAYVRIRMLESVPMLTCWNIRELCHAGWGGRKEDANLLLQDALSGGRVIEIRLCDTRLYPAFQFSPSGLLIRVCGDVNQVLGASDDPWGTLAWWIQPHGGISENRNPLSLLGNDDRLLMLLAEAVSSPVG